MTNDIKDNRQTIASSPVEALSYEQAFQELEEIVAALESNEKTLVESIQRYQRGQELARHCAALLENAELQIQQVSGDQLIPFKP
jgi:exodeoxyribonuclease VII small subunit